MTTKRYCDIPRDDALTSRLAWVSVTRLIEQLDYAYDSARIDPVEVPKLVKAIKTAVKKAAATTLSDLEFPTREVEEC